MLIHSQASRCAWICLLFCQAAYAGIHIRGEALEPIADLNNFSGQLRTLRGYGPPDVTMGNKPTTQRLDFLSKIENLKNKKQLTPDEQADLGGYLLYLKIVSPRQPAFEEAISVMEPAHQNNPRHFALAANLGTAYQLAGKLDAAERCLQSAVDLAPPDLREMELLHLRLVQRRLRENPSKSMPADLDLLFGKTTMPFRFVNEKGIWDYGELAAGELSKLPKQSPQEAARQVQQLLIWLPDDGRLHWQFAEWLMVLKAHTLALEYYQQSVDTFRLSHPQLKQRRSLAMEAMNWAKLKNSFNGKREPADWQVQTLGYSLSSSCPAGWTQSLVGLAHTVPPRKSMSDLLKGGNGPIAEAPTVPDKPFVIQAWHWVLIGLGIVVAVLMLYWQFSEWTSRVFRKPRGA